MVSLATVTKRDKKKGPIFAVKSSDGFVNFGSQSDGCVINSKVMKSAGRLPRPWNRMMFARFIVEGKFCKQELNSTHHRLRCLRETPAHCWYRQCLASLIEKTNLRFLAVEHPLGTLVRVE